MTTKKNKKSTEKEIHSQPETDSSQTSAKPISKGPLIAVIGWNSPKFMEGHSMFLETIKSGIASHGCRPAFFGISGSGDFLHSNGNGNGNGSKHSEIPALGKNGESFSSPVHYWLPSRDIVADQIEMIAQEEHVDGLVMVPWSVNSLVGMLMASARCGIPTLFMPFYSAWPDFACGAPTEKKEPSSLDYSRCSMLVLLEVFGLTRLGLLEQIFKKDKSSALRAPVPVGLGADIVDFLKWGTQRICEISKQKVSMKRFFSQASFHNAACVDLALGSSAETVLHLSAVAYEAGIPLPPAFFNDCSKKIPQLVAMNRSGEYSMEEFEKMGGIQPLLGGLAPLLQASPTVMGRNIVEIAKECSHKTSFRLDRPQKKEGGLAILFGNLAKEGAIFKTSGLKDTSLSGSGPTRVFNSEGQALEAIASKKIKKGDVIILRYCGPRGSPGMPCLNALGAALEDRGLEDSVLVLTDGRLSLPGKIPSIVHVSPEAAVGSTLSIVQDGDVVFWSFPERTLTVRLTETEIKVRLSRWKEQEKNMRNSFLFRYSKYSSSSSFGAKLI